MFWNFSKKVEKQEFEQLKQAVQTGFNSVKQDVGKTSSWIKHLDNNNQTIKQDISDLHDEISRIKEDLESIKNILSIVSEKPMFKQRQTLFNKQTLDVDVLNTVQTAVQTDILDKLSTTERAIVYVLLNSNDMKLSYGDLASMLGKRKATVRGQINAIKQKSEGLIKEIIGENNKKRVFIPDNMKDLLLKRRKVRDKIKKNNENPEIKEELNEDNEI